MPPSGVATRNRLIDVGLEMFATRGVHATPLKAIVEAAGQRNASALHYHFGSREGLLDAIIVRFNSETEDLRGEMLDSGPADPDLHQLVVAWVIPQTRQFESQQGRHFLSVISQLSDLFQSWGGGNTPPRALQVMEMIAERLTQIDDAAVRRERLTRFLDFTAQAMGARARRLDRAGQPRLANDIWVANLIEMCTGALSANAPSPIPPWQSAHAESR